MRECKHFHAPGVLHEPCKDCQIEQQAARIAELERDNAQAKEAIATLNAGKPLGEIVGLHTAQNALVRIKELEAARDEWVKIAAEKEDQLVRLRQRIDDAPVVAWLHEVRQDSDVITNAVKHVWGGVAVGKEAQYTIPLISKEDLQK